jgi:tRNA pseudouridine55 synthase
VGHSGTLDPFATGLLIILIGNATKAQDSFMKKDKWYDVSVLLGATSTTGDPEGEIMKSEKLKVIKLKEVKNALEDFIGEIQQIPPAYSAIKINGQRAYDLARQGKVVEMKSRRVTIHAIENVNYDFPHLSFSTHVSSGTYIRSLVRDIGKELGTGAYTAALRRTVIDTYHIEAACSIEELQTYDAIASRLLSL